MQRTKSSKIFETIIVCIIILFIAQIINVQINNISIARRDDARKSAINNIYYNLESVFYKKNHYYPVNIDASTFSSTIKILTLKDPSGIMINQTKIANKQTTYSDYSYSPTDCSNDQCRHYALSTVLENEATYTKNSKN